MNNLSCYDCTYSADGLVIYSAILAIIISKNMSVDDINLLSVLLQAVGQNLAIISTFISSCNSNDNSTTETN